MDDHGQNDFATRLAGLTEAEHRAFELFDRIEALGLILPGRTEREVQDDVYTLAEAEFGVTIHWHKRIVRCGPNASLIGGENPPVLTIADDDVVWVDLGPVFEDWEADVGRSYVVGGDPRKHALVADLPLIFDEMQARFVSDGKITGAGLYAFACQAAEARGWIFGGKIAGHIVSEFAHAHLPGDKDHHRISPLNPIRMRDPDPLGQERFWIGEVHLVAPDRSFGGFYERLMAG